MKSLEITNLDQHLKPLKIDDKTTPLEVSETEFRVNEKTTIEKSLEVKGDLDIIGDSSSVVFNKNVSLEARSNEDYLTVDATNILLNTGTNYPTTVASVFLSAANGIDSQITFSEAGGSSWSIGNDAGESTATLSFVTGAALGSSQAMSLDADGHLENAGDFICGRDISVGRALSLIADRKIKFGTNNDSIYGNDTATILARDNTTVLQVADTKVLSDKPVGIKEQALAPISADAGYGKFWVKNETPCELYFQTDAGDDIQLTDGTSTAGGGGGTQRWTYSTGGYKVNNNSSSFYYFQYRPNNDNWSNSDSSPTTINVYDSSAAQWIAPAAGTLTNITIQGYVNDTGATDPVKFYVFKGQSAHDGTTTSLTQIGVTGAITAAASLRNVRISTDISSSNTFSEGDALFVMLKKDSTSANQDLYFSVTISGEYS
tara:strand:+ start:630 stop:1925 length:1296 start_codon:yes stop_codon:yes gene_type:complete